MHKTRNVTIHAMILVLFVSLFITGCEKDPEVILPSEVKMSDTDFTVYIGDEKILKAEVLPADAVDRKLTWTSSDPAVAAVVDGKVIAISEGDAEITAETGNGIKGTSVVHVKNHPYVETAIRKLGNRTYDIFYYNERISFDSKGIPVAVPEGHEGKWYLTGGSGTVLEYELVDGDVKVGECRITFDPELERKMLVETSLGGKEEQYECYLQQTTGPTWLMNVKIGSIAFGKDGFPETEPGPSVVVETMTDDEFTIKLGMVDGDIKMNETINIKRLPGSDIRYELTLSVNVNGVVAESESGIEYLESPGLKVLENTEWKNGTETISFDKFGLCKEFKGVKNSEFVFVNSKSEGTMELRCADKDKDIESNYTSLFIELLENGKLKTTRKVIENGEVVGEIAITEYEKF